MKSFFPMRRGEVATLLSLVLFAAFSFIPAWRTIELGGMAVFGWLMAALMVVSPAIALFTFLRGSGGTSGDAARAADLADHAGSAEGETSGRSTP